jgi:6-phosphogluconolactonase
MAGVEVFPNEHQLIQTEAERIVALARAAIAARGRVLLALSGGSTPRPLYELIATQPYAGRIDWSRVHLFWGDERSVPPDHPESNYRMTKEALIDHVLIPADNVHRIRGEDDPARAAFAYERVLRGFFGAGEVPERSFDLVLLGVGADGHTASLFPGTPATHEQRLWVMPVHVDRPRDMWRVTLTPVVLNAAGDITFLVTGAEKAARVRQVLKESDRPEVPAQLVCPTHGTLHWMVDAAAGSDL